MRFNVLNRFYEVNSGSIFIGDINVKSIKLSELRKNIAYIQQEVFLFSTSVPFNLNFLRIFLIVS